MKFLLWTWGIVFSLLFPIPAMLFWSLVLIVRGLVRRPAPRPGHRVVLVKRVGPSAPIEPPALGYAIEEVLGSRGGRA